MCLLSALEKSAVEALSGEKYWQRFSFFILNFMLKSSLCYLCTLGVFLGTKRFREYIFFLFYDVNAVKYL